MIDEDLPPREKGADRYGRQAKGSEECQAMRTALTDVPPRCHRHSEREADIEGRKQQAIRG